MSPVVEEDKFHFHLIKTHLTPGLELKINDLLEEIELVFRDEIGVPEGKIAWPFWTVTITNII